MYRQVPGTISIRVLLCVVYVTLCTYQFVVFGGVMLLLYTAVKRSTEYMFVESIKLGFFVRHLLGFVQPLSLVTEPSYG